MVKVLLDHCVPRPFERHLLGHEVIHTSRLNWGRLANGRLLSAAEDNGFVAIVTVDASMTSQQNMKGRNLTVLLPEKPKERHPDLVAPLASLVMLELLKLTPGSHRHYRTSWLSRSRLVAISGHSTYHVALEGVGMNVVLVILAILAELAGIGCSIMILIDAFQDELWKGLVCLFCGLYGLYYALFEFDHEYKWPIVIGSLAGNGVCFGLLSMIRK